jgi:predicted O-methyltransferase YrrM
VAARAGPGFGYIEAQVLHCFVRTLVPARVIEVGSGVSTHCMLAASQQNVEDGRPASQITCIEPFPSAHLKMSPVALITEPVEEVDLAVFDALEAGDLLFIDSSHAVRPCGDVARIYLEVLPRLRPGVHVHIHDIFLPYAFQREPKGYMQWMETAMLIALISHSPRYKVTLSLSHLHYAAPQALKRALPEYDPQPNDGGLRVAGADASRHFPASTFLLVR